MKKQTKTRQPVDTAFAEVRHYEPERVKQTRRARGEEAAERQIKAIALQKARKMGAKVPRR